MRRAAWILMGLASAVPGAVAGAAPEPETAPPDGVGTGRPELVIEDRPPRDDVAAPGDADELPLSLTLGVDLTSAYFFRGYLQEDQGLIVQPWVELGIPLASGGGGDPSLAATVGLWSSFHSEQTFASPGKDDFKEWVETDLYAGLELAWDTLSLGVLYSVYTYPNSTFNTVQEVGVTVGVDLPDDAWYGQLLGDLTFGAYFETDGSNVADEPASYFQLDLGPSLDLDRGLVLSFPVALGLSIDDYYIGNDDETFGFVSLGAALDVPIPTDAGDVTLTGGVELLLLGETAELANGGDPNDLLGYIGLRATY